MENLNGTTEDLTLYHKNGKIAYQFEDSDGCHSKRTYDEKGNLITFEDSNGLTIKRTYDEKGNQLTSENSNGFNSKRTYDEKGNELSYEDSDGCYLIKSKKVSKEEFEAFVNSAKWQQEGSYSEEEVFLLLNAFNKHTLKLQSLKLGNSFDVKEWFEKFKKK